MKTCDNQDTGKIHSLDELVGKEVIDGADQSLGVVEGMNATLPEGHVYLRIKGESFLVVRGRRVEFIPVSEIDVIEKAIHLYKDFDSLKESIEKIDMSTLETYRVKELLSMRVTDFSGVELGEVVDFGISELKREPKLVVSGRKMKRIRGESCEAISFNEVKAIKDDIKVNLPYETLVQRLKE